MLPQILFKPIGHVCMYVCNFMSVDRPVCGCPAEIHREMVEEPRNNFCSVFNVLEIFSVPEKKLLI